MNKENTEEKAKETKEKLLKTYKSLMTENLKQLYRLCIGVNELQPKNRAVTWFLKTNENGQSVVQIFWDDRLVNAFPAREPLKEHEANLLRAALYVNSGIYLK